MVVEIAANDGYLLQYMKNNSIPCYGIEPTHSTAEKAKEKGIEIIEEFFSANLAGNLSNNNQQADLIIANNVLGHVPNINDFIQGIKILLKSSGVATFEFPHLFNLVDKNQFDTIYHEHYSYISLISILSIFKSNDLVVFDVEEIQTHGGSLRVYAQSSEKGGHAVTNNVKLLIEKEILAGIRSKKYYQGFQEKVEKAKEDFLFFLLKLKLGGAKVVAYGAAAKGNTMLNFSGVKPDLLPYVIDKNPSKQGKYMPGSRIPIVSENKLVSYKPDYVVILPWNLKEEIMDQLNYIKDWGGVFVTAIPKLKIYK
jgi:SAM-dependent methyltransferase